MANKNNIIPSTLIISHHIISYHIQIVNQKSPDSTITCAYMHTNNSVEIQFIDKKARKKVNKMEKNSLNIIVLNLYF